MISDISSIPDKIRIKLLANYLVAMIAKNEICNLHYLLRIQEIMKVLFFDIEIEIYGQQLVGPLLITNFPHQNIWPMAVAGLFAHEIENQRALDERFPADHKLQEGNFSDLLYARLVF